MEIVNKISLLLLLISCIPIIITLVIILLLLMIGLFNKKTLKQTAKDKLIPFIIKHKKTYRLVKVIINIYLKYLGALFFCGVVVYPLLNLLFSQSSPLAKYLSFTISTLPIAISQIWVNSKKEKVREYFIDYFKLVPIISGLYIVLLIISFIPGLGLISDENQKILTGSIVTIIAIRRLVDDIIKQIELRKFLKEEARKKEEQEKEKLRKEIESKIDIIIDKAVKKALSSLSQSDKTLLGNPKPDGEKNNTLPR